jgi:hypothetical protein
MKNITDASHALSEESKTAPDCAKPLEKPRYIERLLGELGLRDAWPPKYRGSRQRPK